MAHEPEAVEAYADAAALVTGITIADAHRPGVLRYLSDMFAMGDLFINEPLPDDTESAAVFRA